MNYLFVGSVVRVVESDKTVSTAVTASLHSLRLALSKFRRTLIRPMLGLA